MSKYETNELYDFTSENRHLKTLLTDLGERTLYDAAAQCNRCGYCETACPTYMLTGRETLSARGRNQFVRLLVEGKAKNARDAAEALSTCLLCGACTSVCYAKVPTADIALEGRRSLSGYGENFFSKIAVETLLKAPDLFALCLKAAYLLKRLGLARLAEGFGLYDFIGLPALADAQNSVSRPPLRFASEILKKNQALAQKGKTSAAWAYFAPCGPNYVFPEVALATVRNLQKYLGNGIFMENSCCGLLAHNYGRLEDAKEFAKKNILRYEELKDSLGGFAVIGDCSSCVAFMKTYEQLFTGDMEWRARAARYSAAVRDILEVIPPGEVKRSQKAGDAGKVVYHDSCRACHGQGIKLEPRAVLKKLAAERWRELPESDWCCGGAGAYAFTQSAMSNAILERKLANIASTQADTVVVGATSCLIQINGGLKAAYPTATAVHYSVFLDNFGECSGGKAVG